MDRATKIALLRRKTELLAENTYDEESEKFVRKLFSRMVEHAARYPRMPESALRDIDRELEKMMTHHVLREDHAEVRDPLIKEFGISRITASSKAILNRVLKRGDIQTEEEYYEIQEVVCCVDNIDRLGAEIYARLDQMAGAFRPKEERPAVVRKPSGTELPAADETPRWPMVPEDGDEHICPAGTSLEVVEKFVRTKLALLLRHYCDPDEATGYISMIESGLGAVNGPMTPADQRDFHLRYRDHELEAFSGLAVTREQLRLVELDLQAQFGFRRLLPSPRRLGVMAIENHRIQGPFLMRLIIERALANYTAPPIFTKEEALKLRGLLKAKPPNPSPG